MSKRAVLPALMITLLLAGCGGGTATEEQLEARRETYAAAEEIAFTAEVTAFLGDEVFSCTLACAATPEEISAEVTAPELVSGVKAVVRDGETQIRYEGVQLSVGSGMDALGPFSAVPILFRALRAGHVIRAWTEPGDGGVLVAAELYADDDYALTMWFEERTLTPVHASLSLDGAELARCEIRDFTVR